MSLGKVTAALVSSDALRILPLDSRIPCVQDDNSDSYQLKTVLYYRMTLISCLTGRNSGCCPLTSQNVRCYILVVLPILVTIH